MLREGGSDDLLAAHNRIICDKSEPLPGAVGCRWSGRAQAIDFYREDSGFEADGQGIGYLLDG